jgi:Zn-dependent protease with chaperone function
MTKANLLANVETTSEKLQRYGMAALDLAILGTAAIVMGPFGVWGAGFLAVLTIYNKIDSIYDFRGSRKCVYEEALEMTQSVLGDGIRVKKTGIGDSYYFGAMAADGEMRISQQDIADLAKKAGLDGTPELRLIVPIPGSDVGRLTGSAFACRGPNVRESIVAMGLHLCLPSKREELVAIAAHEMTHIQRKDMNASAWRFGQGSLYVISSALLAACGQWVACGKMLLMAANSWAVGKIDSRRAENIADRGAAMLTSVDDAQAALNVIHKRENEDAALFARVGFLRRAFRVVADTHPPMVQRIHSLEIFRQKQTQRAPEAG